MSAKIKGNVILITGHVANVGEAVFKGLIENVLTGSSVVSNKISKAAIDEDGNFSIRLVAGDYGVQIGSFKGTIRVPDTVMTYDISSLFISEVNANAAMFGVPSVFGNGRYSDDGVWQLLNPTTGLYHTPVGSAVGGFHIEWGPGEAPSTMTAVGFPSEWGNGRYNGAGVWQLFDPVTLLYHTPVGSAVGGFHIEWGAGEA